MSIIAVPVIWTVSAMYYSERLAIMEAKVKALEERAAVLEKVLTSNQKTRIEGGGAEFKAADLYVPSTPIKLP